MYIHRYKNTYIYIYILIYVFLGNNEKTECHIIFFFFFLFYFKNFPTVKKSCLSAVWVVNLSKGILFGGDPFMSHMARVHMQGSDLFVEN